MQPQNDGTFMLYIKAQENILIKVVKHQKVYSCKSLCESAKAYWQQVMLSPVCQSSSTRPSRSFIVFWPTDITQVTSDKMFF